MKKEESLRLRLSSFFYFIKSYITSMSSTVKIRAA